MSIFSELGNRAAIGNLGAIPKSDAAYKILQAPQYQEMGDVNWKTGETWGVLISGAALGLVTVLLFNRYYK
tara:strand:- start:405 stop:617 length:213 start_codon:yes stop_codon:yes gene_type:complete